MLRYPSTKQILTVAVISALLAGCGKDSKKATADSNISYEQPKAERLEADFAPVETGSQLQLTESSDVARQDQAVALAAIVLTTTLNVDKGSSVVKEAISVFAGAQPRNTATGAMTPVLGGTTAKCSKGGVSKLTLFMGEGEDVAQTGAFNKEEIYFDALFENCNLGTAKVDGQLGMSLQLGIAELINKATFRIETSVIAQDLVIDRGSSKFAANGEAGYKFYTNNGYELTNEFYADSFELDIGMNMNLLDLNVKQVNNTSTNDWALSVKAKYQGGKSNLNSTFVNVTTSETAPLKGKGYGYPMSGDLRIETAKPNPQIPDANIVTVSIVPTIELAKHPLGSKVKIAIFDKNGAQESAVFYSWAVIETAVQDYVKTGKAALPDGEQDEGVEN